MTTETEPTTPTRTPTAELVATFVATFVAYNPDAPDGVTTTTVDVVNTYRPIPVGARAGALSTAMAAAIAGGTTIGTLTELVSAVNAMPTASATRVRAEMSESDKLAIRFAGLAAAYDAAWADVVATCDDDDADPYEYVRVRLADVHQSHADAVKSAIERTATAVGNVTIGDRTRTVLDDRLTTYVPAGSTITGTRKTIVYTAVVNDDGTVTADDGTTGTVSTVATKLVGNNENGWRFWTYNGRRLAAIRGDASV